jgi:hypothetical protein
MSFGKNPYVVKAQQAEQKAADAPDDIAKARAYRDAAHQWERAATREGPGKRRDEYEQLADKNRRLANGEISADEEAELDLAAADVPEAELASAKLLDPKLLN